MMGKKSVMSIIVKVDGEEFETFFDEKGVQRFKINTLYKYLDDLGKIDHLEIAAGSMLNKFSLRDHMLFEMGLGHPVSTFNKYAPFHKLTIENPADYNKEGGP